MSPTVSMQKAFFKRQSAALMSTDGFYAESILQSPVGCTDVYRRFPAESMLHKEVRVTDLLFV
jgi:hypothetical protein